VFAQDACFALIKGPIAFDVEFCKAFDPGMFDTSKPKYKFIEDLDPQGRKELLDSYRGLVVKGTVVMSRAIKSGVSTTKVKRSYFLFLRRSPAARISFTKGSPAMSRKNAVTEPAMHPVYWATDWCLET
jgi:hypothetical protein